MGWLDVVELESNENVVTATDVGRATPPTIVLEDFKDPRSTKASKLGKVLRSVLQSWRNSGEIAKPAICSSSHRFAEG
jgi:hypothetical protein